MILASGCSFRAVSTAHALAIGDLAKRGRQVAHKVAHRVELLLEILELNSFMNRPAFHPDRREGRQYRNVALAERIGGI
jgi:hypothetical protein